MDSQKTILLFVSLFSIVFVTWVAAEEQQVQANWRTCGDELNHTQTGTDVQVFVPLCPAVNGSESRCTLRKGVTATIIIKFKSSESVPSLERIIVARVPATADTKVEMPYGPAISPCLNSSLVASDGTECVEEGVESGKSYTYVASFDVLQSFPSVQDLETRVILRKSNEKHRKLRLYRAHPGPTVFCIMIPHINVED